MPKIQPLVYPGSFRSAVILLVSILSLGIICLFSSCDKITVPAHAEEIDMQIISQIESNNNPLAYNWRTQARGLCQITPICLEEFTKLNKFWYSNPDYLFNPAFNLRVADWYMNERIPQLLKYYQLADTIENRIRAYNSGVGNLIKGIYPLETKHYLKKYCQKARKQCAN